MRTQILWPSTFCRKPSSSRTLTSGTPAYAMRGPDRKEGSTRAGRRQSNADAGSKRKERRSDLSPPQTGTPRLRLMLPGRPCVCPAIVAEACQRVCDAWVQGERGRGRGRGGGGRTVVADKRVRAGQDLAAVRGIGHRLDVRGHPGGEHHLACHGPRRPEREAAHWGKGQGARGCETKQKDGR